MIMMYSNSSFYLTLSSIASTAGRWGEALSRFCPKGLIPNSGEYWAGAGRMGKVLILRGSMLGVRDRWRRYAEFAINEYPRTRSNHC